jgi:hypothetical protein
MTTMKLARWASNQKSAIWVAMAALPLCVGGCTMDATAADEGAEPLASVSEELADIAWGANVVAAQGRGMSVNANDVTFLWTGLTFSQNPLLGYFCTGDLGTPCKNLQFYQTPYSPSTLRGVAISKTNRLVYSYFDNGMVCEGTAANLASRQILRLTVPAGLDARQLMEVEQSTGGTWHYWWKKADGVMVLTTSRSATDGGTVRAANVPYVPAPWVINGVVIDDSSPNLVWTYYSANDGTHTVLNVSDTASSLHQF